MRIEETSMAGITRLRGVLYSTDAQVLSVMNQVLDNFEIETQVCMESAAAIDAVTTRKLDTLIMDWNGTYESGRILSAMRSTEQNAKSTVLALVKGDREMQAATQAGANFIVFKPMDVDQATRFVRAAYGNMLLQRRKAPRVDVDVPAVINVAGVGPVKGKIINLSVSGLAFICEEEIKVSQELAIAFSVPGNAILIHATGKVVNVIPRERLTRVGVSFTSIPPNELKVMERWIPEHLPALPKKVAGARESKGTN
jgi:response regulator RpfG family c-di-GMP phosphodiesterase